MSKSHQTSNIPSRPSDMSKAPAGWYKNPAGKEALRWWDGQRWTNNVTDDASKATQLATEGDASPAATEDAFQPAGWYPDPKGEADMRWWDGAQWLDETATKAEAEAEQQPSLVEGLPAIRNWKTSVCFSVLGFLSIIVPCLVITIPMVMGVELYLGKATSFLPYPVSTLVAPLSGAVWAVLCIVYAQVFYPSYFREKPFLKSRRVISFANLLFGGIIFGCLWNSNLTRSKILEKPEKGSSYNVLAIFSLLQICFAVYNFTVSGLPVIQYAASRYERVPAESIESNSKGSEQSKTFLDSEFGVSFTIPSGWEDVTAKSDVEELKCWLVPKGDSDTAQIAFMAFDDFGTSSEEAQQTMLQNGFTREDLDTSLIGKDDALWYAESDMDEVLYSNAEPVTIQNREYWMATARGYSGEMEIMRTIYMNMENGFSYRFVLVSMNQTEETNEKLNALLLNLVESARYE